MSKTQTAFHGSDLEKIEAVYGIKKEEVINFAANVNPYGISSTLKEQLAQNLDVISSYPDRDYTLLRKSIGEYCNANPDHIVVGNGSTELISIMAQFLEPQSALILSPTYSEYSREVGLAGGQVCYFELKEKDDFTLDMDALFKEMDKKYDMLIICNPNNPTSGALHHAQLREIFEYAKKTNTFIVIDETYVEFARDYEDITAVTLTKEYSNFIVLRGVSKFFAAPGIRLGYAITSNQELLETIRKKQNPWTVNSLAEQAGILMFKDAEYIKKTQELMWQEQDRMYDVFAASKDFKPYKASANFILLKILNPELDANVLFERCIQKGFMIRNCASFPYLDETFIRFCFMKPEDNDKLVATLMESI